MFDRDREWDALVQFACDDRPGATLAVVSGRRRQGKSYLLQAIAEACGGFYFEATEEVQTLALSRLGRELGQFLGSPGPIALPDWQSAVDGLLNLGAGGRPVVAILDELPYLLTSTPALASIIQHAYGPRRRQRLASQTRLILCGSAFAVMGTLMAGQAPLRGRAVTELVLPTLDYRLARDYWQIDDPRTALLVHAVVGGTPAYKEMSLAKTPQTAAEFDDWVTSAIFSPFSALQREARYLFSEDLAAREQGIYHSIMTAIAQGHTGRGQIAAFVGRKTTDLAHPLQVLQDAGYILKVEDAFGAARRPVWSIAEPIMAFYYAVMRPVWSRIEHGSGLADVWTHQRATFASQIMGPHFEQVARTWGARFAQPATFGAEVITDVGHGVIHGTSPGMPAAQVDVVVHGQVNGRRRLVAIGEAKWSTRITLAHYDKLAATRAVLSGRGTDTSATRLAFYSTAGFDDEVRAKPDAVVVDSDRLYSGH